MVPCEEARTRWQVFNPPLVSAGDGRAGAAEVASIELCITPSGDAGWRGALLPKGEYWCGEWRGVVDVVVSCRPARHSSPPTTRTRTGLLHLYVAHENYDHSCFHIMGSY